MDYLISFIYNDISQLISRESSHTPCLTQWDRDKGTPLHRRSNIPALVQLMACRRIGDKPFYEPIVVGLLTHICVTWPQWVKSYTSFRIHWFKCLNDKYGLCSSQFIANIWGLEVNEFAIETKHYGDVIMGGMASQITSLTIVYSTVWYGAN